MPVKRKKEYFATLSDNAKEQVYNQPDDLLSRAFEYFAWCTDNPWHKKELMRSGERKGEMMDIPVARPYTLSGLCVYCGISEKTFSAYCKAGEMRDAAMHILNIIRQNQEEGALAGMYNSSFVSRLLDQTGEQYIEVDGRHPIVINITDPDGKQIIEEFVENVRTGTKGA